MAEPVVVAIQRGDTFRLFRANGQGATEIGYLNTGPLADDAAVVLALGISQLLDSTPAPIESHGSPVGAKQLAPSPRALPTGTTAIQDEAVALVAEHPGLKPADLAKLAGVSAWTMSARLARVRKARLVRSDHGRYYLSGHKPVRGAPNPNRRGSIAVELPDSKGFVAYVAEHPGLTRDELRGVLGYKVKQTLTNRINVARKWGAIRVDADDRVWPTES